MNKLVLLRHGESQWNLDNKFTGWTDIDLTKKGESEAYKAGRLIKDNDIYFDDDSDGDGIVNYRDSDDDNDGILTKDEYDVDQNGIPDDTDNDGTPDYLDNN